MGKFGISGYIKLCIAPEVMLAYVSFFLPYIMEILNCAFIKKNGVFWDVTLCGSCKNRRFGGT
jgi:hypothetical protein